MAPTWVRGGRKQENRRLPATLTVKWRFGGQTRKWGRSSASCRFPLLALPAPPNSLPQVHVPDPLMVLNRFSNFLLLYRR
jgi:hypothetical protein